MLNAIKIAAPLFSLLGVLLGTYGTYLSVRGYTPFSAMGYFRNVLNTGWLLATGRGRALIKQLAPLADVKLNREKRSRVQRIGPHTIVGGIEGTN